MELDRNGLEVLGRDECIRLLGTVALGRLAVTSGSLPTVFPVNFLLDHDRIVVSTGRGTKLDAAIQDAVVAFEVDEFDTRHGWGWSVVVTGWSREIDDHDEVAALRSVAMNRWAPQGDGRIVAISTELISGRRMRLEPAPDRTIVPLVASDS